MEHEVASVYHILTTVDDLVPQGANASADILNTTFSLFLFFSLGTGSITLFLTSHDFFVHVQCIFQNMTKKYDNEKIRIAQPRRPGFKQSNPVIETNIFRLNK